MGIYPRVSDYVKSCLTCLKYNYENRKPAGLMKPHSYLGPWTEVSVDLIGPLPPSKDRNVYLLVIVDIFSGWVEAFPLRKSMADSKAIVEKLLSVFCRWGFPKTIISDNGPQFISKLWNATMFKLGIQVKHTSPYNPQANPVERKNRDIKLYLSKFCGDNHKNWDENIQPMLFSLRTAVHRSTGYTPARLLLGKELHGPLDILLDHNMVNESSIDFKNYAEKLAIQLRNANIYALENRMISGEIQKNYYDLGRREVKFEEGDLVLCRSHFQSSAIKDFAAKLAPV